MSASAYIYIYFYELDGVASARSSGKKRGPRRSSRSLDGSLLTGLFNQLALDRSESIKFTSVLMSWPMTS